MRRHVLEPAPPAAAGTGQRSRALTNLVDNAAKFTDEWGRIDIVIWATGRIASIQVADSGVGMSDAETAHAFDRFWRAQDARATPGFGLGLPLVRQIISAHRGKATIISAPGSGTTVALTLTERPKVSPSAQ